MTLELSRKAWLLMAAFVVLVVAAVLLVDASEGWGDNGFPTESSELDSRWLKRTGDKDLLPALNDPPLLSVAEAAELKLGRKAMLYPTDRVLGLVHGGQAVCVPARVMNWHEVVNLEVGGDQLVLTFSALADAPQAYLRDGAQLGHSGLLYCSTPLLYDVGPRPSLWSMLDGRARSGPRRGDALTRVPVELAQWGDWIERFPETRVVRGELEVRGKNYRMNSYGPYLRSDVVRFPAPAAPAGLGAKQRVVVVEAGGTRLTYPVSRIRAALELPAELEPGKLLEARWTTEQGGQPLTFVVHVDASEADPDSIRVEPPAKLVREGLWFALSAFEPELELAPE